MTDKEYLDDIVDLAKDKAEFARDTVGRTLDTVPPSVTSWLTSPWVILLLALLSIGGLVVWLRSGRSTG